MVVLLLIGQLLIAHCTTNVTQFSHRQLPHFLRHFLLILLELLPVV